MNFLSNTTLSVQNASLAFNYTHQTHWNTNNVSGFQKRIALLSGMTDYKRKDLFDKAMYIDTVEHANSDNETYFEYRWLLRTTDTVPLF